MFRRKPKEFERVSLDKLLATPEKYNYSRVEVNDLVIDNVVIHPRQHPVYIIAHNGASSKKGVIYAYEKAIVIALLSKPGHRINVKGIFYQDKNRGKYIEAYEIENQELSDIEI